MHFCRLPCNSTRAVSLSAIEAEMCILLVKIWLIKLNFFKRLSRNQEALLYVQPRSPLYFTVHELRHFIFIWIPHCHPVFSIHEGATNDGKIGLTFKPIIFLLFHYPLPLLYLNMRHFKKYLPLPNLKTLYRELNTLASFKGTTYDISILI